MELKEAKCTNCSGVLQLDPSNEKGKCMYCGSEVIVADAIKQFKGEVDGVATTKSSLQRAKQCMDDNNFDAATKIYKKILEFAPTHHEAWWGLFLNEVAVAEYYLEIKGHNNYNTSQYLSSLRQAIDNYGKRAIEYSPDNIKEDYKKTIEEVERKISSTVVPEKNKSACYIATEVYGSQNSPEVLCLKKYRDESLSQNFLGQIIIRTYYLCSPQIAEWLHGKVAINRLLRQLLNKVVARVSANSNN